MTTAHSETYKGFRIDIIYDEGVPCPFDYWDCEPPLAVYVPDHGSGRIQEHATKYGTVNRVPWLSKDQLEKHHDEIANYLNADNLSEFVTDSDREEDDINEAIREAVDCEYDSRRLEVLERFYRFAGIPALYGEVTGCSQGDWAYVLAVATKEFQDACGNAPGYWDDVEKLRTSIQLYEDWAFGNVYGFRISRGGKELDHIGSSVWGFFGDYDADNGVLSEARAEIDCMVDRTTNKHFHKVKAWIKNHVPLIYRTPLAI